MYTEDRLYIIDVTSPFFVHHPGGHINWSKIPYSSLDRYFSAHSGDRRELELDIERYFATVSRIGYNAVSMDELSRLVSFDFYPPELKRKISLYRKCYRLFFRHAIRHGLRIFVTTDFMFYNRDIDVEIGRSPEGAMDLMRRALVRLFEDYPEVNGVIFRIGECDGVDVEGDFRSRLVLKNAAMVNDFISGTLPIFEERTGSKIMRTGPWELPVPGISSGTAEPSIGPSGMSKVKISSCP
jgi:hypothetical protein